MAAPGERPGAPLLTVGADGSPGRRVRGVIRVSGPTGSTPSDPNNKKDVLKKRTCNRVLQLLLQLLWTEPTKTASDRSMPQISCGAITGGKAPDCGRCSGSTSTGGSSVDASISLAQPQPNPSHAARKPCTSPPPSPPSSPGSSRPASPSQPATPDAHLHAPPHHPNPAPTSHASYPPLREASLS